MSLTRARETVVITSPEFHMPAIDGRRVMAVGILVVLGFAIAVAVWPYLLGLIGAPIIAVLFRPMLERLTHRFKPGVSAVLVVIAAALAILVPAGLVALLLVDRIPSALSGPGVDRMLAAIATLRVGRFEVGPQLSNAGGEMVSWLSRQAMWLMGGVTNAVINLFIAFIGCHALLLAGERPWRYAVRFLPFSVATAERLRVHFVELTRATILGVGVTAMLQGGVVGLAFAAVGLENPLLWGVVTGIVSILPVFGSALVWVPGVAVLLLDQRAGAAISLALVGIVVASNIDNVVRPLLLGRASHIHPLVAVVGAFAGMRYFGLLGLLLGPLALVYFAALVRAFEVEYIAAPRSPPL